MNREFFEALRQFEQEKKIPAEYLLDKISEAIVTSVRRSYGGKEGCCGRGRGSRYPDPFGGRPPL